MRSKRSLIDANDHLRCEVGFWKGEAERLQLHREAAERSTARLKSELEKAEQRNWYTRRAHCDNCTYSPNVSIPFGTSVEEYKKFWSKDGPVCPACGAGKLDI